MIRTIRDHRYLTYQVILRDIKQRYRGTVLGTAWIVIVPFLMLGLYTLVFGKILGARWEGSEDTLAYAFNMIVGLLGFNAVSDIMTRSVTLIQGNVNYVKKTQFPLKLLPLSVTATAFVNMLICLVIVVTARAVLRHELSTTIYQTPAILLLFLVFCLGTAFILSAVAVYIKDFSSIIGVLVTIVMFASPIFYGLNTVPAKYRWICKVNPLSYYIVDLRKTVIEGMPVSLTDYAVLTVISVVAYLVGCIVFDRAQIGFADVL